MNSENGQVYYCNFLVLLSTTVCSQNINKQNCKHSRRKCYRLQPITAFSIGITIQKQRISWKDDIEFVTEFSCLLGHPVLNIIHYLRQTKVKRTSSWNHTCLTGFFS